MDGVQRPTGDVKFNYTSNSALYITNLQTATQGGVWNGNVTVTLNYGNARPSSSSDNGNQGPPSLNDGDSWPSLHHGNSGSGW